MNIQTPASRLNDPQSSHEAEGHINRSGARSVQQEIVLSAVRKNPGHTSRELTGFCELDRYQIARRLADLEQGGFVFKGHMRECTAGGRNAVTWFAKISGQMELF